MKKTNSIVSIPQAVSTVATKRVLTVPGDMTSFNTASGKYCCNIVEALNKMNENSKWFQYRKR